MPGLYIVVCGAIAGALLWGRPTECLAGLGLLALGLPFYAFFRKRAAG